MKDIKRYVIVPEPIQLTNVMTGRPLKKTLVSVTGREIDTDEDLPPTSLYIFLTTTVMADQKFGQTWQDILAAQSIIAAVKDAEPGTVVALDEAHWEKLKGLIEKPSVPYDTLKAVQLIPLICAITGAGTTPPDAGKKPAKKP